MMMRPDCWSGSAVEVVGVLALALNASLLSGHATAQDVAYHWVIDNCCAAPDEWGVDRYDGTTLTAAFSLDTALFSSTQAAEVDADGNLYVLAEGIPPLASTNLIRNGIVVNSWNEEGWDMVVTADGEAYVLLRSSVGGGHWSLSRWFEGAEQDVTAQIPPLDPDTWWPRIDVDSAGGVWCFYEDESQPQIASVLARDGATVFTVPANCTTDVYVVNLSIDSNDRVFVMSRFDCPLAEDTWVVYRWDGGGAQLIESGLGVNQPDGSSPDDFGVDLHGRIWILEDETTAFPVGCELLLEGVGMAFSADHQCQGMSVQKTRWRDLGHALSGTIGKPLLTARGSLRAGQTVEVTLSGGAPSAPVVLFVGYSVLNAPGFYGGTLVPDIPPNGVLLVLVTDAAGAISLESSWPPGVPPGFEAVLQCWVEDPGGPFGFAASNGMIGTVP